MNVHELTTTETGLEVIDIEEAASTLLEHTHPSALLDEMEAMRRIARAFASTPETILQELVQVAVEFCGADSAGISVERDDRTDEEYYRWIATAGDYRAFNGAVLPRYPSACTICLERGSAQRFRVSKRFFDILGIEAPLVTDGILLPWTVDEIRGTIFVMAHGRTEAFGHSDVRMMEILSDLAATGVRLKRQQERLLQQATTLAAAAMANELAHKINNPLQSLTNVFYLASEGAYGSEAKAAGLQASGELNRLSTLVQELLLLPFTTIADDEARAISNGKPR